MATTYGFDLGAVGATYTAEQHGEVFEKITGCAVADYSSKLALSLGSTLTVTVGAGYAYVAGRWIHVTQPVTMALTTAYAADSRYDAVALVIYYEERKVTLEILTDIDPDSPTRDSEKYVQYLYVLRIPRSATSLSTQDVTDLRVITPALGDFYATVQEAFEFTSGGMEDEVDRIVAIGTDALDEADVAMSTIRTILSSKADLHVGDLKEARNRPAPSNEWLQCNGATISTSYAELRSLIGTTTPSLSADDSRFTVWIYAGEPS